MRIIQSIQNATPSTEEEKLQDYYFCPWNKTILYTAEISKLSKEEEAEQHKTQMLQRLGDNLLAIYTDASSIKKGTGIGIGVTALDYKQQAKEIYSTKYNISKG
ncbi:uncharacterized protein M421DRAFT_79424 [Didymella exigua CBS 183.55]|uniref:Uncharacterized protein n=2 Tax=Didymella exigua CBS 183.55 TaxID=1150837 RepID=A0A6A5R274_9PLEO|nr:uncharacterized protein M421DRAFT_79424 [Didymella exigua CBS 183.55]KAF1922151.1 hypothetical protein M421DRAFT_79424 [Didymella exigua CBS 183.55]